MNVRLRRLHACFEGHVQGVGFRFTAVAIASRHTVTGFVRNLPDGDVDLIAEGDEADLNRFLIDLRASHICRHVRNESLSWSEARGEFSEFGIRYDI